MVPYPIIVPILFLNMPRSPDIADVGEDSVFSHLVQNSGRIIFSFRALRGKHNEDVFIDVALIGPHSQEAYCV